MIEAVTFDWWDTIALTTVEQDRELRELRIDRLLKAVPKLPLIRDELLRAYDRQQAILEEGWERNVDPAPEEQVRTFLQFAGLDPKDAILAERVSEAFGGALQEVPPNLFPHVREDLEAIPATAPGPDGNRAILSGAGLQRRGRCPKAAPADLRGRVGGPGASRGAGGSRRRRSRCRCPGCESDGDARRLVPRGPEGVPPPRPSAAQGIRRPTGRRDR